MKRAARRKREKQRLQEEELKLQETEKKLKEELQLRRREREEKQEQEEEQRQGTMIVETASIQVDDPEQPAIEEEGEQMQDWELAKQIEQLIEVTDMELEQESQWEDTDLILKASHVISQSPPPPVVEPSPSEQGDTILLDDDPVMDVYHLSFDEYQKRIVQARRKHFPDDHTSSTFIKERVIVSNTRKHPPTIAQASLAYAGATSSNVQYLTIENEQLEMNLQAARKEAEQL